MLKTKPWFFIFVVTIGLSFSFNACTYFKEDVQRPAKELANEGMRLYNREKYRDAIKAFQQLKDWYPFSKYASLAELKLADSQYHLKNYDEAIIAYEEFVNLHPRNEAVPYVIYQIGRCYFDRIDTVDRDQSVTRKALETFNRLRLQFPDDVHANRAADHIARCQRLLAEHKMYVGRFYYESKHYRGAISRFENVLATYPDTGFAEEAKRYIELSQAALRKKSAD